MASVEAWGIRKPNGALLPAATAEEGALFEMLGGLHSVSEAECRRRLEAAGYRAVRVRIAVIEGDN